MMGKIELSEQSENSPKEINIDAWKFDPSNVT